MVSKKCPKGKYTNNHSKLKSRYLTDTLQFLTMDEEASFFLMMEMWGAHWTGSRFKRLATAMEDFAQHHIANQHRLPVDETVWRVIARFVERELAENTMTNKSPPVIRLVAFALASEGATATKH